MQFFPFIGYLLDDLKNFKKTGDLFHRLKNLTPETRAMKVIGGNLFSDTHLMILDTNMAKEIATKDLQYYKKSPQLIDPIKLITRGITVTEGDEWKKRRKLNTSAFHYEFLRDMIPETFRTCKEFIDLLNKKSGQEILVAEEFKLITGDVIGRIFLGEKFNEIQFQGKGLTDFVSHLATRMNDPLFLTPLYYIFGSKFVELGILPSHKKHLKDIFEFKQIMLDLIHRRFKDFKEHGLSTEPHRKSLLEIFYEQQNKHPEDSLSEKEILDEVLVFYLAGMDTTGIVSSMAAYYAAKYPELKKKLEVDIKELLSGDVTLDRLNKMDYMTAFIKETLRMSLPGPSNLPRVANVDHKIGDLTIKKGTTIMVAFFASMFNPDYFENPHEFNPNRWITGSAKTAVEKNPYLFTPFWVGQRNCIGQHLAMSETKIILSLFIANLDFELPENYEMKHTVRTLYEPYDPIKFRIKSRNNQA